MCLCILIHWTVSNFRVCHATSQLAKALPQIPITGEVQESMIETPPLTLATLKLVP